MRVISIYISRLQIKIDISLERLCGIEQTIHFSIRLVDQRRSQERVDGLHLVCIPLLSLHAIDMHAPLIQATLRHINTIV